ncbi:MAG: hypothetical protein REI11_03185 [Patulibacter sp.]|nr:hypothetical protein [Patulibacter sp.]
MPRPRYVTAASITMASLLATAAVALGAAGDADTTFGSKSVAQIPVGNGGTSSGAASAIQDGKLVVAGRATVSTGDGIRGEIAVTRLNADGSRDTSFGTNGETTIAAGTGESEAFAVAITADDKVVVAGSADDSGSTKIAVARLTTAGKLDTTFNGKGFNLVARGNSGVAVGHGIVAQPDGSLVVAATSVASGVNKISMVKVSSAGAPVNDGSWGLTPTSVGSQTDTRASGLTRLADGSLVVTGQADTAAGTSLLLARYAASNGALTAGWGNQGGGITLLDVGDSGNAVGNAVAASGTRIAAVGSATDGAEQKAFVAAFSASNGAADPTFGSGGVSLEGIGVGGSSEATGVAFDAGGNVVIGGSATDDSNGSVISQFLAARFLPNGALDPSFATGSALPGTSLIAAFGVAAYGASVSIQPDGKFLVAGRVGDGDGETLAAARFCTSAAQGCNGTGTGTNTQPAGDGSQPTPPANVPQPFECGKTIAFGIIEAQGCLQEKDGKFIASGNVDVNGIIMRPEAGATIVFDPAALRLSVQGPGGKVGTLSARIGSITIFENLPLDIKLPSASVPTLSLPNLAVSARGSLFGFPITGKADLALSKGGVNLNVLVGLPKIFGGVTGAVTLRADLVHGLQLDGLQITAKDALLGPLEVKDLLISYSDSQKLWTGSATVFLKPFPYGAGSTVQVQNGSLKTLTAAVDGLNVGLGGGVFLQRISFGITTDPLAFLGGISFSAGPQVAGVSVLRIDGNLKLSFPGKPLAKLEVSGSDACAVKDCPVGSAQGGGSGGLVVAGFPLGGYHFSADTDGNITFGGNIGIDLTLVSLTASIDGWIDGVKAFNIEGHGTACVFSIACAGADAVVSSKGLAACGHVNLLGVEVAVGFGIEWPLDVSVMAPSCDIGPYRAVHAAGARASAARVDAKGHRLQAAPITVNVPKGKDYALVRLTGDSAPPMVTVSNGAGATVDTPAAPSPGIKTDQFMVFKDYDKKQTIVVIAKPGTAAWTITPDAGSAGITNVEQADPLPPVKVKAKVSGTGYKRKITYDATAIPGQSIEFSEVGSGVHRLLGTTTKAHGTLSFTPGEGDKGRRQIVAVVNQGALPRTQFTVASYTAPARRLPSKIRSVTVKRTKTSLSVKWGTSANADTYRVTVTVSDGRVLMFNLPSKTRSLTVPDLISADSAKVKVGGVTDQLRTGPTTPASLKAVPAKKTKKSSSKKKK